MIIYLSLFQIVEKKLIHFLQLHKATLHNTIQKRGTQYFELSCIGARRYTVTVLSLQTRWWRKSTIEISYCMQEIILDVHSVIFIVYQLLVMTAINIKILLPFTIILNYYIILLYIYIFTQDNKLQHNSDVSDN